ncbi:MAG TPA: nuclear transport factor 2 family protein [Rudaea sp.]|nr:nuclear transport factor 2 family protein [Rudaea sp.]
MKISTLSGFALLAITTLASAGPAADNAAAEKQIRASLANWVEAANRGDFKTASEVWAPDLIGWAPEGPDDSYAREAAGAKLPVKPPKTTYALTINEVIVDGSLAVVRDTWTQTTKQGSGADKVGTFRSFEIWRRQPDQTWKISRWIDGPMMPAQKTAGSGGNARPEHEP